MAWSTPRTWTVGEVLTAGNMNTYVSNDLAFLGTPPSARVYNTAAESIANVALTALTFNSERYKTDAGMHSTSVNTDRLVCTVAGKYVITASVEFDVNATGIRQVLLTVNGGAIAGQRVPAVTGFTHMMTVTTEYALAVNDYVQVFVYQNSGGALNVLSSANYSPEAAIAFTGF